MAQAYIALSNLKSRLGISDTDDDTLLTEYVDSTNAWIEHETWRPIGPTSGGTATFDGYEDVSPDGSTLYVVQGVRSITSLTVAPSTGASAVSATVADLVILPRSQNRRPDWPGFEVRFKDVVTGSVSTFGHGYGDIVLIGDLGWAAIPDDLSELGYRVAVRAWHARKSGQTDLVGSDEMGNAVVSRFVSKQDWRILHSYRPAGGMVVA